MSFKHFSKFKEIGKTIIGAARTYREHATELNNPVPTEPIVFLKPTSSYISEGEDIILPIGASELHHEVELGVVIGTKCSRVSVNEASDFIGGYVLALDMTDRLAQGKAKKEGLSWSLAKGFDTACPVSEFIAKEKISEHQNVDLWLKVNGTFRQQCNTKEMIFSINQLISWISHRFTMHEGDVILTGTPPGVGPVKDGDVIECGLGLVTKMTFKVKARK